MIKSDRAVLRLPIRTYQMERLYGPGMAPGGAEGYHEKTLARPVDQVGLVSVHCWNLGEPTGPYPIDPTVRYPGQVTDWVPAAHWIIDEEIRPVLDAAREAGVYDVSLATEEK